MGTFNMKNKVDKIAVCSRSFSKNLLLRNALKKKYSHVKFNDEGKSLYGKNLIKFLDDCNKCIVGLEKIDKKILISLPKLKKISKYGVGIDHIDTTSAKQLGKKVSFKAGVNRRSISELSLALIILLLRDLKKINNDLNNGKWASSIGLELTNKTVGIIGFGNIGQDLAKILKPFNCKIIYFDKVRVIPNNKYIQKVSLRDIAKRSDVISIHLPLNKKTYNSIDKKFLNLMKSEAILINTSRGGIVNETDLYNILKNRGILAAASDVFLNEPVKKNKLLKLNNFFGLSHVGSMTKEAILRMGYAAIRGLD
tara:strand:+ start:2877 stop:3806 length:930 start_codon:yes stop_codon:yes gene_type:complete